MSALKKKHIFYQHPVKVLHSIITLPHDCCVKMTPVLLLFLVMLIMRQTQEQFVRTASLSMICALLVTRKRKRDRDTQKCVENTAQLLLATGLLATVLLLATGLLATVLLATVLCC